jgi:hypothetical protein
MMFVFTDSGIVNQKSEFHVFLLLENHLYQQRQVVTYPSVVIVSLIHAIGTEVSGNGSFIMLQQKGKSEYVTEGVTTM